MRVVANFRRALGLLEKRIVSADSAGLLFEVATPLGLAVRVTSARWNLVTTAKHPVMAGRENLVKAALETPDQVRQSRMDPLVLLFYKAEAPKRWTCAVVKRLTESGS